MRLTLQQAADGFQSNALKMQATADDYGVVFDSSGKVSLMMAQSLARFVSGEFEELFGTNAKLSGQDIISVKAAKHSHQATLAGISLLEDDFGGIVTGGTCHYQVEDIDEVRKIHAMSDDKELQHCLFIIRDTNVSTLQALADAYMLGNARVQQAVRNIVGPSTRCAI